MVNVAVNDVARRDAARARAAALRAFTTRARTPRLHARRTQAPLGIFRRRSRALHLTARVHLPRITRGAAVGLAIRHSALLVAGFTCRSHPRRLNVMPQAGGVLALNAGGISQLRFYVVQTRFGSRCLYPLLAGVLLPRMPYARRGEPALRVARAVFAFHLRTLRTPCSRAFGGCGRDIIPAQAQAAQQLRVASTLPSTSFTLLPSCLHLWPLPPTALSRGAHCAATIAFRLASAPFSHKSYSRDGITSSTHLFVAVCWFGSC